MGWIKANNSFLSDTQYIMVTQSGSCCYHKLKNNEKSQFYYWLKRTEDRNGFWHRYIGACIEGFRRGLLIHVHGQDLRGGDKSIFWPNFLF